MRHLPSLLVLLLSSSNVSAFTTTIAPRVVHHVSSTTLQMASKVGVFFGTSTGSTEEVADMLVEKLGVEGPFDVDDGESIVETFRNYDALIVGTPTWNTGADVERSGTGWDELYYGSMTDLQLAGKKVAVFGLGDSVSYAENFSDAAGELHDVFEKLGCKMYGYVSQEGYEHEDSKSIRGDKFCGLLLDMVNQEELTEERVDNWIVQLTQEGFLEGAAAAVEQEPPKQPFLAVAPPMPQQEEVVPQVAPPVPQTATTAAHAVPQQQRQRVDTTPLTPDSPLSSSNTMTSPYMAMDDVMQQQQLQSLEQEQAILGQQLDEHSSLLDETIETHSTGYAPHTNPVTGRTMWTSPDGRSCYFTESATMTKQSTSIAP